ncbi:hypothetical protein MOQ_003908 [Trypanosoma cruzi marinkellei]|uniref:Uncharacterized protein n=1 Tax=Trypanosoma cruzi marinkellei TaxID=85056 RepID=K2N2S6_TRYCR|nr:hypothetical protein MOQ_003908 [Trypanosoma cruzi marinkellei]
MCAESTATLIVRGDHRGTLRHVSAHTEQRPHPAEQKQREEKNDPKSRQHLHAWRASCSRISRPPAKCKEHPTHIHPTAPSFPPQSDKQQSRHVSTERRPTPRRRKEHSCSALCKYLCVCVCAGRAGKKEEHREAHQHSKRHSWMATIHALRPSLQQSRTVAAHTHPQKQNKTKRKNTAAGCGCVCVALRVSASPGRNKTKQEGKKCVLRPTGPRRTPTRHGSLSTRCVAAPPHACSRRGAQGRRHERVGGCASGAVGRETHGTPHRKSAARNN